MERLVVLFGKCTMHTIKCFDITGRNCSSSDISEADFDAMEQMYENSFIQQEPSCPPTRKTTIETTTLTEVIGEWVTDFEPDQQQQQQQQDSERTTRKLNIHKRRRTPTYGRSNSASNILFHKSVLIFAISLIFISI